MDQEILATKLGNFGPLDRDDRAALVKATQKLKHQPARSDIIAEGVDPDDVFLIIDGLACRYKTSDDGERQIVALLLPGDFCDLHVFILDRMDHSIGALSPCTVASIPRQQILDLLTRPAIARGLWMSTLVDEAILREWLLNIGSRDANKRLAHLFCEMHLRLAAVGLARGNRFELPLTQADLGDVLGLSTVHVNRTMQVLRASGMVTIKSAAIEIHDVKALRAFADFKDNYLHLRRNLDAQ